MTDTAFLGMIDFMRNFLELREQDGGFMPMCACGAEKGDHGTILLRKDQWLVRCPDCLAKEPPDDRQGYEVSEVICLTLAKYGKRVSNEPTDGGWNIRWGNKEKAT